MLLHECILEIYRYLFKRVERLTLFILFICIIYNMKSVSLSS